jgi:hypothetical protein
MTPQTDPEFLPFKLDLITRRVLLVRLTEGQRRDAAFLDERALPARADGGWVALDSLLSQPIGHATPADAIFHIGHCGSTLLSRLLESWPGVQSLREPLPLRTLADTWSELSTARSRLSPQEAPRVLQALWSSWSRPFAGADRCVIKATSGCNGLVAPLLDTHDRTRVLLLDMPLQSYLATLLKSADSVRDAATAAGERLQYLQARGYGEALALHGLSLPQQCAMGWMAERARFAALDRRYEGRVLRVDFEELLAQPESTLQRVAAHLSLDASGVEGVLRSPAWRHYAKAQDHDYGRDDRAHDLALAMQRHHEEISEGTAWVAAFLKQHPQLEAVH